MRQALDSVNLEANEKTGNADSEPEVATRLFCPQDFLNPGGNNNNGQSYCDRCNCNDWNCRQDCRKCGNYGWSNNNNNNVNCYSCSCSYSSCKNKCSKCRSNNQWNNNNYNNNNQWSSNSGYNSGYRNSQTVNGRTAADS